MDGRPKSETQDVDISRRKHRQYPKGYRYEQKLSEEDSICPGIQKLINGKFERGLPHNEGSWRTEGKLRAPQRGQPT